jgi:hypothetical protein
LCQDERRFLFGDDTVKFGQAPARERSECLVRLHQLQINVGNNLKIPVDLIEHFSMLTRHADDGFKGIRPFLGFQDDRSHLDGFGTSTKNEKETYHGLGWTTGFASTLLSGKGIIPLR